MTLDDAAELVVPFPQRLVAVAADRSRLADARAVWQEVDAAEAKLVRTAALWSAPRAPSRSCG